MIFRFFRNSPEDLQTDAWECLEAGDYRCALRKGRKLIRKCHSSGFEICALAFAGLENHEEAIGILREGVTAVPENARLWQLLGSTFSDCERYEEAMEAYDRAAECVGHNAETIAYNKALILRRVERNQEALLLIDAYSARNPGEDTPALLSLRMDLLNCLGRHQEVAGLISRLDEEPGKHQTENPASGGPEKSFTLHEGVASFAEPDLEFLARGWIEVLIARKALGASGDELWLLVRRAVAVFPYLKSAQWWLRELRGVTNGQSRAYNVVVHGRCPAGSPDGSKGFYRNYTVVADSPETILKYIEDFERGPVQIEGYEPTQEELLPGSVPDGVYHLSGYAFHTED